MFDRYSLARDPEKVYRDKSEFGMGPGPVPPGNEAAPIREGGVYRAKCPPVELTPSTDLSVRVRETRWRPGDSPRGPPASASADAPLNRPGHGAESCHPPPRGRLPYFGSREVK